MLKARPRINKPTKKVTRFVGKTKLELENEKALKIIRSIKGMFG